MNDKNVNKCAIVIPLYKNRIANFEKISIESARRNFNNNDIYFVCPLGLNISNLTTDNSHIIYFNKKYFNGINGYCELCTSSFFYKKFIELGYDYMLIHQTDTYTFYNNLDYFMCLGYDYYGAPVYGLNIDRRSYWYGSDGIGNGGYSLRKLSTMYAITEKYGPTKKTEDAWFCVDHKKDLNKCPVIIAKKFSTIANYITGELPMACHGYIAKHELYKKYETLNKKIGMNKKVIYTCITGGYDSLIEPTKITPDYDYVCFTDDMSLSSNTWIIKPLPEETKNLDNARKNRYIKTHPHTLLPEYETSIYVDGSIKVTGDLNTFIKTCDLENYCVAIPKHPCRVCSYKEGKACISIKKDTAENINPQMERYRKEGFPENYGLTQNNIIVRKHNDENCIKIMNAWWQEILNGSHRDQLSLFYVLWKNQDIKIKQLPSNICNSIYFKWNPVHTRRKNTTASVKPVSQTQQEINEAKAEIERLQQQITTLKRKLSAVKQTPTINTPTMSVLYNRETENGVATQKRNVTNNIVIRQKKRVNKSNMRTFF